MITHLPTLPSLVSVLGLAVMLCIATMHSLIMVWSLLRSWMWSSLNILAASFTSSSPVSKPRLVSLHEKGSPSEITLLGSLRTEVLRRVETYLQIADKVTRWSEWRGILKWLWKLLFIIWMNYYHHFLYLEFTSEILYSGLELRICEVELIKRIVWDNFGMILILIIILGDFVILL